MIYERDSDHTALPCAAANLATALRLQSTALMYQVTEHG